MIHRKFVDFVRSVLSRFVANAKNKKLRPLLASLLCALLLQAGFQNCSQFEVGGVPLASSAGSIGLAGNSNGGGGTSGSQPGAQTGAQTGTSSPTPTPSNPLPPPKMSCAFNGTAVAHASTVQAFEAANVAFGQSCKSEVRACTDGTLSGSYSFAACAVAAAPALKDKWTKISTGREMAGHRAVWTGSQMIVLGGNPRIQSFDPATLKWTTLSTVGAPSGGWAVAWTGSKVLVWGSATVNGIYDPNTDSWTKMSTINGPVIGDYGAAWGVWTGTRMVVYGVPPGGTGPYVTKSYDPAKDKWEDLSFVSASWDTLNDTAVVMNGVIVGVDTTFDPLTGAVNVLDPLRAAHKETRFIRDNAWPTTNIKAVFTGDRILQWGSRYVGTGASFAVVPYGISYSPTLKTWTPMSTVNSPPAYVVNTTVMWTGSKMLIYGGVIEDSVQGYRVTDELWIYE